ncbi:hypothetical protein OG782_10025 [Streptomyces sp. NBC_00876]|uniref:hypothetical protein n=1 Tax=Streptomyces sp. NBC_00876 TaxID=2975853 RepID=UPI003866CDA5|nr:hypothetical protein OG782_10025 [Streptomyces sp. NBC_00876]
MAFLNRGADSWVCPVCLRRITRADIAFRCVRGRCGGGRRLSAADPLLPAALCDSCGRTTSRPHCGRCDERLPEGYLRDRSRVVVLAGPAGSGRSTFTAVALNELRHRLGEELGMSLLPCDDRTATDVRRLYEQPLYEDARLLPAAHPPGSPRPLVHRLSRRTGRRERALTFVLLDTSDRQFAAGEPAEGELRMLAGADAVVLLLDPRDLPGAVPRPAGRAPTAGSAQVVDRVLDRLRTAGSGSLDRGRIGIPVAVAVAKLDLVTPQLPPNSPLHRVRSPGPGFDAVDRSAVDTELRALLALWQSDGIDQRLREACADCQLFAFSALGVAPRGDAVPPGGPRPHRVEDPLLWLLHRFGLLDRAGRGR